MRCSVNCWEAWSDKLVGWRRVWSDLEALGQWLNGLVEKGGRILRHSVNCW